MELDINICTNEFFPDVYTLIWEREEYPKLARGHFYYTRLEAEQRLLSIILASLG